MIGIMIDQREPDYIKAQFPGAAITMLETGDAWIACDDGNILMVERKTSDDLLNSLRDGRLLEQISRLVDQRHTQYLRGERQTYWPYLVITGELRPDRDGRVWTGRQTGWAWNSIQGALLTIQEMGCYVVQCPSDTEYHKTVEMLINHERKETVDIAPQKLPVPIGAQEAFLCALPEIGIERARAIMEWSGGKLAHALSGLTDMGIDAPVGKSIRSKIRGFLGLAEQQSLDFIYDDENHEKLVITKEENHV
jgi:ERCC4-type nuclease